MRSVLLLLLIPGALAAQRPGVSPPPREAIRVGPPPQTPYDSTVEWIADVGSQVAGVRSAADQLRRAGYSFPDGVVSERLELLQGRCRALARTAREAQRGICRNCVEARIRPVLERYRAQLTSVTSFANRCSTQMRTLRNDRGPRGADRARATARTYTGQVAAGLQLYEQRVGEIRIAFGWAPPASPRRTAPTRRPQP